jgi:hypothetical protein
VQVEDEEFVIWTSSSLVPAAPWPDWGDIWSWFAWQVAVVAAVLPGVVGAALPVPGVVPPEVVGVVVGADPGTVCGGFEGLSVVVVFEDLDVLELSAFVVLVLVVVDVDDDADVPDEHAASMTAATATTPATRTRPAVPRPPTMRVMPRWADARGITSRSPRV